MNNVNFKWLVNDTYMSIVLKLYYNDEDYGTYEASDVIDTTGSVIDIEFANIDDITNLLTLDMIRFINTEDSSSIIDIPIRKMYMLYENGYTLEKKNVVKEMTISELEAFSIIDGSTENDFYKVKSFVIEEMSSDLKKVYDSAKIFGNLGMQEKFDTLSDVNVIDYRRVLRDKEGK